MNPLRLYTLTLLAAATLAACGSMPAHNTMLDQARSEYRDAQASSQTQTLAPAEMRQAADALARANEAFARDDDSSKVTQLAYLARQRVALATEAAGRKDAEATVAEAGAARDRLRLDARTREADAATRTAAVATQDAADSQRQSAASQQQARSAQQQANASQQRADASQQQAATSMQAAASAQQQADDSQRRNAALEAQLRELNAKKTERGMVITIGDVLFDTNQAQLKSGGMRGIERLSGFLKEYPQRKAAIEGYTDSTGSDSTNMALSGRRADAVLAALIGMGVNRGQLAAAGYGESYPVAGNDSSGGRQMNRRVEIVLSDETGAIAPR
ncbi:Flagellar motor protein MotB [Rubrivivax sp. A210]|uniref:OmpA family protein n=1 Tax=Rubrivivax sp. A210 TaxID=2772301 RepID=UPI00191AACD1|nr:OmpA family protein [Rubrivivax sp. A210]CAD5365915.1 Flagellar motor protein MotB [Rubrivivax sp. A210]